MEASVDVFLSLVIPAYNEAAGIGQAIVEADAALRTLGRSFEILVVDDGSSDDTSSRVIEATQNHPAVRLLRHETNQGYGAALRTGFTAARGERIAFTDADCQFHLEDLGSLLTITEEHDIAAGYRAERQDSACRRFYSWGYNKLIQTLLGTGLRDCDCALKVFRREALAHILPESRGFFVNTEMITTARQLGLSVAEVPVRHRPRLHGESKVHLSDIPRTLRALLPFWWSRILFPGVTGAMPTALRGHEVHNAPTQSRGHGTQLTGHLTLLMAVAGLLFFTRLDCPLLEPDEARYAEIPRQMLAEGSFITPVLNGEAYLQKPPLLYWMIMASYQVFGVHDWAARIVPATTSMLLVLLVYFWARRTVGVRAALWSGLLLCFSARFVYQSPMIIMDGPLTLWVTAGLGFAHLALHSGTFLRGWWLLSALSCGSGLLTKGPVALVLVLVPLVVYHALDRRAARVSLVAWAGFAALAMAIAAPWYVGVMIQHPAWAMEFFWVHNVRRFFDPIDHSGPIWSYVPVFLLGTVPWIVLLLPALRRPSQESRPAAAGFFAIAMIWPLLFFSLSECKRPAYILPAFPPLALLAGMFFAKRLSFSEWLREGSRTLKTLRFAGVSGVVGVFALGLFVWLPAYHRKFGFVREVTPLAELAADSKLPIVCYPRGSESVNFYLKRSDVRTFSVAEQVELLEDLKSRPRTLMFVRGRAALQNLLQSLPKDMRFHPRGTHEKLSAGIIERETANQVD